MTDVSLKSELALDRSEISDYKTSKLLVTVNLDENKTNVKIKLTNVDILFTGDIFQNYSKYAATTNPEIKQEATNCKNYNFSK